MRHDSYSSASAFGSPRRGLRARLPPRPELGIPAELDVGPAARHVRGDRDRAFGPGLGDNHGLARVVLRVENLVPDASSREEGRQPLGFLYGHGADEHRLALFVDLGYLVADGVELLRLVHEDQVVLVGPDDGAVGRDDRDVEVVDLHELRRLRIGGAGHAGYFFIQAEEVLEGDGSESPVAPRDLDALLGLDGLVQAVGVAPTVEYAPGELVDDLDHALLDDVVHVLFEELWAAAWVK